MHNLNPLIMHLNVLLGVNKHQSGPFSPGTVSNASKHVAQQDGGVCAHSPSSTGQNKATLQSQVQQTA